MRRAVVGVALITVGGLSIGAAGLQQPQKLPPVREIQQVRGNLYFVSGGDTYDRSTWTGGNTAVLRDRERRRGRRHHAAGRRPEPARAHQVDHRQAGDHDHQHPHALRPLGQQHRVPGDGRVRGAREYPREHGEGDLRAGHQLRRLQGRERQVPAEAHLQGSADAGHRRRPGRSLSLRPRPHERRHLRRVPGGARHAHRRHVPACAHAVHRRREQRRRGGRVRRYAAEGGRRRSRTSTR